jgi:hypothetical protein
MGFLVKKNGFPVGFRRGDFGQNRLFLAGPMGDFLPFLG